MPFMEMTIMDQKVHFILLWRANISIHSQIYVSTSKLVGVLDTVMLRNMKMEGWSPWSRNQGLLTIGRTKLLKR